MLCITQRDWKDSCVPIRLPRHPCFCSESRASAPLPAHPEPTRTHGSVSFPPQPCSSTLDLESSSHARPRPFAHPTHHQSREEWVSHSPRRQFLQYTKTPTTEEKEVTAHVRDQVRKNHALQRQPCTYREHFLVRNVISHAQDKVHVFSLKGRVVAKNLLYQQALVELARYNLHNALECDEPDIERSKLILEFEHEMRCLQRSPFWVTRVVRPSNTKVRQLHKRAVRTCRILRQYR